MQDYRCVYNELRQNGACKICSYRFLCNSEFVISLDQFLESRDYEIFNTENTKLKKNNNCVICLGMLEEKVIENAKQQILNKTTQIDFDCETYMLALILPVSCKLREHSTFLYLKSKFPSLYGECPYAPRLGLKESWRFYACDSISKLINKKLDTKSELIIQVTFSYDEDCKDYQHIAKIIRQRSLKGNMNFTSSLKLLKETDFAERYPFPMETPSESVYIKSVTVKRESIFFAGRYNKFSRELSQTPWILADGERKMKLSVEEIISDKLKDLMKADDSRFSSSGREDVDVRTLGNGRPFGVELLNPRISNVSYNRVREIENEINEIRPELIYVRDLQIVSRTDMINLKKGEEHKMKEYSCVCLVKNTCNIDDLRKQIPETPLQIQQKTPIRVLHRRTVATRPKTIHTLTIHNVKIKPPQGCTIFKLNLKTEAGTYIKEFVHGDFGRTQPNISIIFGNIPVDVLELDVTNVEVNWPPAINYKAETKNQL